MSQPINLKSFTLTIIRAKEKRKNFKISSIKKLVSPLNVKANKRKSEKPFKSISWYFTPLE